MVVVVGGGYERTKTTTEIQFSLKLDFFPSPPPTLAPVPAINSGTFPNFTAFPRRRRRRRRPSRHPYVRYIKTTSFFRGVFFMAKIFSKKKRG